MPADLPFPAENTAPIPFFEFVVMIAALMSLGALGIDSMLPALPDIGRRLGVPDIGDRTLIITVFMLGFGAGQPVLGPLTDRFGRRPVLGTGLAIYVAMSLLAGLASSFPLLLVARFLSGLGIAASRVVVVAIVRDCFSGRAMAKVSSLAFMVFMAAPVIAPSIGQVILLVGSWRLIFETIGGFALVIMIWFLCRMPETLAPENRRALSVAQVLDGWRRTIIDRGSLGYTIASTILQGALFTYITSIQPIMADGFHRPDLLGMVFAASAGMMAVANLLNSRIVMHIGMRRISQGAIVVMIVSAGIGLAVEAAGRELLLLFVAAQAIGMAGYGLASSNMSAMAMEKMGAIAGTASSLQGFVTMTVGAVIGTVVTRMSGGSGWALHLSFLVAALLALGIVAIVERGRLFRPS